MRNIILITALLSCLPFLAQAQYPANPGKMRLGIQTTGQGLVFVTDTVPTWTPSNVANAWMALDTSANQLWCYANAAWGLCSGDGVDSLRFASDTLWVYQGGDSLGVEIIAGGASIYTDSGTVAPIADMLVRLRADTTFSIAECEGCTGLENFWNGPKTADKTFRGFFNSQNYWGSVGAQNNYVLSGKLINVEMTLGGTGILANGSRTISTNRLAYAQIQVHNGTSPENARRRILFQGRDTLDANDYRYVFPSSTPSVTLNDTTMLVWIGNGVGANSSEPTFIPYGGAGATVTASNGLTKVVDDVQLGGPQTANVTVSGNFKLTKSGTLNSEAIFEANNAGTASTGVSATGSSAGVVGTGDTYGVRAVSELWPLGGWQSSTSTNTVTTGLRLQRSGTYTGAAGNGIKIDFSPKTDANQSVVVAAVEGVITDPTDGASDGSLDIRTMDNNVLARKFSLAGSGQLTLDGYTTNTFIGSGWGRLAVDASGVVVVDTTSAGGSGDPDQTLSASRDTVTISGTGNSIRTPGVGYLRDSVTTTTLTIDLKEYNQAIISIRMTSATTCTLTVNNPWAVLTDATAPSYEGQTGVYTFRFWDISGTDSIVWPAAFKDMGGTALGTDSLTAATTYTCYYDPVTSEYYCQ